MNHSDSESELYASSNDVIVCQKNVDIKQKDDERERLFGNDVQHNNIIEDDFIHIDDMLKFEKFNLSAEQKLAWWYSFISSSKTNILSQLGAIESMFISLDGLIFKFGADLKILESAYLSHSFLVIINRIETFLARIKSYNIDSFYLVSFDCFDTLMFRKKHELLALKKCFTAHLLSQNKPVHSFKNWYDESFTSFVNKVSPFLFLCEDGSCFYGYNSLFDDSLITMAREQSSEENDSPSQNSDANRFGEHGFGLFYSLLHRSLELDFSVALLYDIQFEQQWLNAYSFTKNYYSSKISEAAIKVLEEEEIIKQACVEFNPTQALLDMSSDVIQNCSFPPRRLVLLSTLVELLHQIDNDTVVQDIFFYKVFIYYIVMHENMSIKQRKCKLPDPPEVYIQYLNLATVFLAVYTSDMFSSLAANEQLFKYDDSEYCDMFDEVLLRRCYLFFLWNKQQNQELSLDAEILEKINELWTFVLNKISDTSIKTKFESFLPIEIPDELAEIQLDFKYDLNQSVDNSKLPTIKVEKITKNLFYNAIIGSDADEFQALVTDVTTRSKLNLLNQISQSVSHDERDALLDTKSHYIYSKSFIEYSKATSVYDEVPQWINSLPIDERTSKIHKWRLKRQQEAKVFARNVNKFMGSLSTLHKPFTRIGTNVSTDHQWYVVSNENEKKVSSTKKSKPKKEKKVTTSAKAAVIISKNSETKAEKTLKFDQEKYGNLHKSLIHIFQKRSDNVSQLYKSLLEVLLGARNSADVTILTQFTHIDKHINSVDMKLSLIEIIINNVMNVFTTNLPFRKLGTSMSKAHVIQIMGLAFRIVEVACKSYTHHVNAQQIIAFQKILLLMGLRRSCKNTFWNWIMYKIYHLVLNTEYNYSVKYPGITTIDSIVSTMANLNSAQKKKIKELAATLLQYEVTTLPCNLKFDFAIIEGTDSRFELEYFGNDMARSLGSISDSRVCFKPDDWQVKMLDAVDNLRSCLVIAPTSSGKTFACYYAMEQVLRYDDESVVLFVAPTRALALQVESEVIARFTDKTYLTNTRMRLFGRLFDDKIQDWDCCQILITLPSAIEVILSSSDPSILEWKKKIKYAIIDEVHCIGDTQKGLSFQHMVQLMPCPFMSLSATLSNQDAFANWLKEAQPTLEEKTMDIIVHSERYAHTQTLLYSSSGNQLMNLNPFIIVSYEKFCLDPSISEMQLTPFDCLAIYLAVCDLFKNHKDEKNSVFLNEFDPETYFSATAAITKSEYLDYSKKLFYHIHQLFKNNVLTKEDYNVIINKIDRYSDLSNKNKKCWYKNSTSLQSNEPEVNEDNEINKTYDVINTTVLSTEKLIDPVVTLSLIKHMEEQQLLPTLIFNFERSIASKMFYNLISYLLLKHHAKYHGTPELSAMTKLLNKQREDEYKLLLQQREKLQKYTLFSKAEREEQGIDEKLMAELSGPLPPEPTLVEDDHDSEFFICDARIYKSHQEEFQEIVKFCKLTRYIKSGQVPAILLEALKRGIGLYHDSLHREYRRAVELLFRARYVRIVITDIALSMGINMPCRTTVFAGPVAALTPLLYRQTAGRAGRRGFDAAGSVIFWDFNMKTLRHLLCSELNKLNGEYPMKPEVLIQKTNYLRAICSLSKKTQHLNEAVYKKQVTSYCQQISKMFLRTLHASYTKEEIFKNKTLYQSHYMLLMNLLYKNGAISNSGWVNQLSSVLMSFGNSDSNALFFLNAILSGYLSDITIPATVTEELNVKLFSLFEHCVHPMYFTHSMLRRFEIANHSEELYEKIFPNSIIAEKQQWSPLVNPMDEKLAKISVKFNNRVLTTVKNVYRLCALKTRLHESESKYRLPFTRKTFSTECKKQFESSNWEAFLSMTAVPTMENVFQSAFENGFYDSDYSTIQSILSALNFDLQFDIGVVPLMNADLVEVQHPITKKIAKLALKNSYIKTLYKTKHLNKMITHNEISAYKAYNLARETLFIVKCIVDSLNTISEQCKLSDPISIISKYLTMWLQQTQSLRTQIKA